MKHFSKKYVLRFLLIVVILFFSIIIMIEPVFASVDLDKDPKNAYIRCGVSGCSSEHQISKDKYETDWKAAYDEQGDSAFVINPCILCKGKHCYVKISQSSNSLSSYKIMVGANSSVLSYKGLLFNGNNFSASEQLGFDIKNDAENAALLDASNSLAAKLIPLGVIILVIYFILDLGEMVLDDRLSYETMIFNVIKTILGIIIIVNSPEWIEAGIVTCSEIFQSISTPDKDLAVAIYDNAESCIYTRIVNGDDLDVIGEVAAASIYCFTMAIAYTVLMTVCATRLFDICIRVIFAPIGLSDFMHGGTKCLAVRYFKKLIASVLQGAAIAACLISYQAITQAIRGGGAGPIVGIICALTIITTVTKIGGVANDALGE